MIENLAAVAALDRLLRNWGGEAVAAEHDNALPERLAGHYLDLMIVDRHLGAGRDAFAAAGRLERVFGRPVPGLILTGDDDVTGLAAADRQHRRALQKPASPAVLDTVLRVALEEARASAAS